MKQPKYTLDFLPSRLVLAVLLLFSGSLCPAGLFPQESILASYERSFVRASLSNKAGILRDAVIDDRSAEFIGPLYEFALQFILNNGELLRDDPDMIALVDIAVRGAGTVSYKPSAGTLWKIFSIYRDTHSRVEILRALAVVGKGNTQIVENLNQFVVDQNSYFRSGMLPDYPALQACVAALSVIGNDSSFPALFSAMGVSYPEPLASEIITAAESIEGNYSSFLIEAIRKNPPAEKLTAFRAGIRNSGFSPAEKGELAEAALEVSLDLFPGSSEADGMTAASALRYESALVLTDLKWTRASPLAIRNFYRVQTDFGSNAALKEKLLEAIACLGAMGNSESAQVLALQLGYINSQAERGGAYDEDLILAFIQALGAIGDKAAFDHLHNIGYLDYPERIQAAARESLNRLRW
jgi:hypothetical protein